MKLLKLTLENFKGIKKFTLDTDGGESVSVYGDNGAGKTTVADAASWLLFDKDSKGNAKFDIKTLDENGVAASGLNHSVEGVFVVTDAGDTITLKKVFYEKWTKKRGSAYAVFSGNTTDYYIDDVPTKLKEYTAKVSEIADEEVFKLLTSPSYFAEQLHWQKCREILLQVCGDISNVDVINSSSELAKLPEILGDRTIDNHKKVLTAKRTEINKELERIPVRIDEVFRGMPEIPKDLEAIKSELADAKTLLNDAQKDYDRIESGGQVAELRKQLAGAETEVINQKNKIAEAQGEVKAKLNGEIDTVNSLISECLDTKNKADRNIKLTLVTIKSLNDKMDELRAEWHKVNESAFDESTLTCPTCGQGLPENQIVSAKAKFNDNKANQLTRINQQGQAFREDSNKHNEYLAAQNDIVTLMVDEIAEKNKAYDALKDQIAKLSLAVDNAPLARAEKKRDMIKGAIADLAKNNDAVLTVAGAKVDSATLTVRELEAKIGSVKSREDGEKRIAELKDQEKKLAADYEDVEMQLFLIEKFIKAKVNLLEAKINSKFKQARFRLFVEQINEGVKECCEVLYNGVPFSSGLNNGARINVGLDIISTLSEHYGVRLPVFVDNSESVTKLQEIDTQVIRLVVSEADQVLRVAA